jgi:hypothetical protein
MLFTLTQSGHIKSQNSGTLNDLKSWVKSFSPDTKKYTDFKLIDQSYTTPDATHSGLIYYLHACWAKELGCVLRPDMIYYTVLAEIAKEVLDNSHQYKLLFTTSQEKPVVVVQNINAINGGLEISDLINLLEKYVVNKNLFNLVCNTTFKSDDTMAKEARCMAFANMGVPYFDYMTTMCGIKSLDVQGDFEDWTLLANSIKGLCELFDKFETTRPSMPAYLEKAHSTVLSIIDNTFNSKSLETATTFFSNVFHYGPNAKCGSGHSVNMVCGWVRDFYNCKSEDLVGFGATMAYVPYSNIETNKKFVQVITLAYSNIVDGVAIPHYGKLIFEVLNEKTFNDLAFRPNTQSNNLIDDLYEGSSGEEEEYINQSVLNDFITGFTSDKVSMHYSATGEIVYQ